MIRIMAIPFNLWWLLFAVPVITDADSIPPPVSSQPYSRAVVRATSEGRLVGPYVFDAVAFVRLADVLQRRIELQAKHATTHFEVVHLDNTNFEMDDRAGVLRDFNTAANPIISIKFKALGAFPTVSELMATSGKITDAALNDVFHELLLDSHPMIELDFGQEEVRFTVKGPSEDWVIASRSEIETLLRSMAESDFRLLKFRPVVGLIFASLLFLLVARTARNRHDRLNGTRTDLQSYIWDIHDPYWSTRPGLFWSIAFACGLLGVGSDRAYAQLVHHLFPTAVFDLGDGIQRYQSLVLQRNAILYSVLLALIISVIGSIIANRIDRVRISEGKK